jgi:hypothetical protein
LSYLPLAVFCLGAVGLRVPIVAVSHSQGGVLPLLTEVFIDNPTAWKRRAEPPAELPAFRERLAALGIDPVAVHASYLVNLAGPSEDLFERSVALLAHELATLPPPCCNTLLQHLAATPCSNNATTTLTSPFSTPFPL